jgi:phage I-like protein
MNVGAHPVTLAAVADAGREQEVHLFPAGRFAGRDGRGPYELAGATAVIEATRRHAGRARMPVDYDHAIDLAAPKGLPAPAAGWIKGLRARADGIWALVEWTERAAGLIQGKEYRYLSPVFEHHRDGRITRILRAALTNNPNLELTALAAAEGTRMDLSKELRQLLALPDDANEGAILASVIERLNATTSAADPTQYVPIGELVKATAELQRVNRGVTLQTATNTVDGEIAAGRLPPFLRDWAIGLATVNAAALQSFIERTVGDGKATLFAAIAPGVPPGGTQGGRLTSEENAVAQNLGLTVDEFTAAKEA